ncbi:MAG: ABC transporter permease [Clostridiales bacterium]|nr:ABC transporter permease [Clostridiales bacterium]
MEKKIDVIDTWIRLLPLILLVIIGAFIQTQNQYFLTVNNVASVLLQASSLALMALGMTIVLITGGIDLSIPPVMASSAILGVMFMARGGNPLLAFFIMIGVGAFCGAVNGFAVAYMHMIPFVVTLSMQMIAYGFSQWITNASGVTGVSEIFHDVALFKVGAFTVPVVVVVVMVIAVQLYLKNTYLGRWLFFVGNNEKMASVSGIPAQKTIFSAYVFSGLMAGLAAVVLSARMNSAASTFGEDTVVADIIAAAVVGGASTNGGVGTGYGALIGALFITLVSNVSNMLHISYNSMLIVKGGLIIIFVILDVYRQRRRRIR